MSYLTQLMGKVKAELPKGQWEAVSPESSLLTPLGVRGSVIGTLSTTDV